MYDVQHSMHFIYHCSTVLHDSTALEDSVLMPAEFIIYSPNLYTYLCPQA